MFSYFRMPRPASAALSSPQDVYGITAFFGPPAAMLVVARPRRLRLLRPALGLRLPRVLNVYLSQRLDGSGPPAAWCSLRSRFPAAATFGLLAAMLSRPIASARSVPLATVLSPSN